MSPDSLEKLLRDLPRYGTLVKDRGYRQVWKFDFDGRGYYLKFYPRSGVRLKRLFRGSPARREFVRLQALQRAGLAAPRAVAQLIGFALQGKGGDAVIISAVEPAVPLDRFVADFTTRGEPIPDRRDLTDKILRLLHQLGNASLGHDDLHLGNLLLRQGELYLLDAYAVRFGGLKLNHVMKLAHSVQGLATRADLQRGWNELGPGGPMPRFNPVSARQWRKFSQRALSENDYFGKLKSGPWRGIFFKQFKYPPRWAPASNLIVTAQEWQRAWPRLWEKIESDQLPVIKRGASGDVLAGEVTLAGQSVPVVVKRSFKRYWYRYFNEIGRGSRAWRAWNKAWVLVARGIPTAWPLVVMQKRSFGYITDGVVVFEKSPGAILAAADLDAIPSDQREMLFRRTGAVLRRIDDLGLSHFDAKASNWIVQDDPKLGPRPLLIDVDGIRFRRWPALGIRRLLRSMKDHPQYSVADSLALCQGYAPFSRTMVQQEA